MSAAPAHQIAETLLFLEDVTVSFDGFKALNNLSLEVGAGEMRAIIGPNGAGKTTMMDVITGKTRPDSGRVAFRNIDLTRHDEASIATMGIGRKFQKPTVFDNHTVWDNLELALKSNRSALHSLLWKLKSDDRDRIAATLGRIGLKADFARPAGALSHGQKQWLEIGMLLMQEPELLLVDEPVAGMTDAETEKTADAPARHREDPFRRRGRARHGFRARPRRPRHRAARGLGALRRQPRNRAERSARHRSLSRDGDHAHGRQYRSLLRRQPGAFGRLARCRGGQGRLRARPQRRGQDQPAPRHRRPAADPRRQPSRSTARTSQSSPPPSAPAPASPSCPRAARSSRCSPSRRTSRPVIACLPRALRHIPDEIFELFPVLKNMLRRRGGDLSGGQQQQLAIARALVMRPRLLLLDEPTEGIQPSIIKDIERVIMLLRERGGMAIVLVEQYFEFARRLADSFLVLDRGRAVLAGAAADLDEKAVRKHLTV